MSETAEPVGPPIQLECSGCLRRWPKGQTKTCICGGYGELLLPGAVLLLVAILGALAGAR